MNAPSASTDTLSKEPTPDLAEQNAYFPSPYSLRLYTSARTDFDGTTYPKPYRGGRWKVLMIATDERYILMRNGKMFSTGNHPVEMLMPMYHLDAAGFDIEVATLSGNPVKLEMWAMPAEDTAVQSIYAKYLPRFKQPSKLADLLPAALAADSPYLAVFVPGGHGVLARIPDSAEVGQVLRSFTASDRFVITLCHGPACLLAAAVGTSPGDPYAYAGYNICVFPDALDEGANIDIGYMPGALTWLVGEKLKGLGVNIMNSGISGEVHRDRKLLTGDSPLASHQLGKMAAQALLNEVASDCCNWPTWPSTAPRAPAAVASPSTSRASTRPAAKPPTWRSPSDRPSRTRPSRSGTAKRWRR